MRHAKSVMNDKPHLIGGRSNDAPLSMEGSHQSELLGYRFLKDKIKFDEIYSSSAIRTLETSKPVCDITGYPLEKIITSEELLELSQGDWEGRLRAEVYTPQVLSKINSDNWHFTPPNGESQRVVEERMLNWIHENLITRYTENLRIGIFGHGTAFKCALRGIMGFSPKMTYKIVLDNTSITRLQYSEKGWHLLSINDCAHLKHYRRPRILRGLS